jgi:Fe-S-cluster-containing hydrogenase component 2
MRKVIVIDEEKCDGCGECVTSCAEGAIAIVEGKARLVSETYCDGLGACLGHCPQDAIHIEEREAPAFDEAKTREHLTRLAAPKLQVPPAPPMLGHQCPGSMMRSLSRAATPPQADRGEATASELTNWPIQMMLAPPSAPWLRDADVLLVADCVPFALADFHSRFLRGRPVLIGCPKLDQADFYVKKLAQILQVAQPRSLTVVHMEVPCCSGLTRIATLAREAAESTVPLHDVTISIQGEVLEECRVPSA